MKRKVKQQSSSISFKQFNLKYIQGFVEIQFPNANHTPKRSAVGAEVEFIIVTTLHAIC